jgi:hypothetical protein
MKIIPVAVALLAAFAAGIYVGARIVERSERELAKFVLTGRRL